MTQKTVGYVELEWTCKRCGTRNPGMQKTCSGCGSPMSEQDKFEAPAKQELITDKEKLEQAQGGPDVHCPYCNARNPAGSQNCVQCGANLADAKAREAGRVVGAHTTGPVAEAPCPYCSTPNPADAAKCKKCGGNLKRPAAAAPAQAAKPRAGLPVGLGIGGAVFAVLLCICAIAYFVLAGRTSDTTAIVELVQWERSIQVLEERPVEKQDWEDQIPSNAQKGSCEEKVRKTQSDPPPANVRSEEVCGTPYTIDQGSGAAKVVQDCEYKIYDNWCKYSRLEWTEVDKLIAKGNDLNPQWPNQSLRAGQREGERAEKYVVNFSANDKQNTYSYRPDSASEFSKFQVGSEWTLKINTFGTVTDVQTQ